MLLGLYIFGVALWLIIWGVVYTTFKTDICRNTDKIRFSAQMTLLTLVWPVVVLIFTIKAALGLVKDAFSSSKSKLR